MNDDSVGVEKHVVDAIPTPIGIPKGASYAPMDLNDDSTDVGQQVVDAVPMFIDLIPKFIGETSDAAGKIVDLVRKIENRG